MPFEGKPGWNLTTGMADEAITRIRELHEVAPNRPWFIHYAAGGAHAPHHPTPEWIARFRGQFDDGWEVMRERIFTNQQRLGVLPPNAVLSPWPDTLPRWTSLSTDQRRLYARQAEVFAAYRRPPKDYRCDVLSGCRPVPMEYFQAKWNHLATRKIRSNNG